MAAVPQQAPKQANELVIPSREQNNAYARVLAIEAIVTRLSMHEIVCSRHILVDRRRFAARCILSDRKSEGRES